MTARSRLRTLSVAPCALALMAAGCGSAETPARGGREIAVEGTAQEVVEVGVFVLADRPGDGDGDALLVIDPRRSPISAGDHVRVAGQLRRFRIAQASQVLERSLDDDRLERFEGKTYVHARLVERRRGSDGG